MAEIKLERPVARIGQTSLQPKLAAESHADALQRGEPVASARLDRADDGLRHARVVGQLSLCPTSRDAAGPDRRTKPTWEPRS
jgi:hypothetical protein